ncbi:MAG: hypothetical protein H0W81_01890 [Chloroflexi bacterium]|nr:hypothetical protein [Chloroflexota bacterium]
MRNLDFGIIGFGIIGIFVVSWTASTLIYRWKRYDSLPIQTARRLDALGVVPKHVVDR